MSLHKATLAEQGASAAIGLAAGAVAGVANLPHPQTHMPGLAAPAYKFADAATHAFRRHQSIGDALGAGATAVIGGPAVVAAMTAAAPVLIGVAAAGAAVAGLCWLFGAFDE